MLRQPLSPSITIVAAVAFTVTLVVAVIPLTITRSTLQPGRPLASRSASDTKPDNVDGWRTFERNGFPWIVRYPSRWYADYGSDPIGALDLWNFDYLVSSNDHLPGSSNITIYRSSFMRSSDVAAQSVAGAAASSAMIVAGLPATRWDFGSPPDAIEVRVYSGECYHSILLGVDWRDPARAQRALRDFDGILNELRRGGGDLAC
jgi:hypothetical protein